MESDKASSHGGSTSQASSNGETKKKRERQDMHGLFRNPAQQHTSESAG